MARTADVSRWNRFALPSVVIDAPQEDRRRRDRIVDGLMYLVAFAIGVVALGEAMDLHPTWLRPITVVAGLASVVALRWRRSHPAAVGIAIAGLSIVIVPAAGASFVALFNAAVRARGRDLAVVAGLVVVSCVSIPTLYPSDEGYAADLAAGLLITGVAIGWGLFVRARRELLRSLREQAARAGEEAREAERRRIAREMHDVLAHRLSLLSVHAGALEFNSDAPAEEVAQAAGVIRESARSALEESRAAGMRIDARIELGDVVTPAAAGRTAYRIAQEGLTNARKHAPGAAVTLVVVTTESDLRVEVRSLAPVAVAAAPLPGAGTGLIGLAERVTLAGGQLDHGVDPDGAFVLRARLPR